MYIFSRDSRPRNSSPLKRAACVTVAAALLGLLIIGADTAVHYTTNSVNAPIVEGISPPYFTHGLAEPFLNCTKVDPKSCAVSISGTDWILRGPAEPQKVFANSSSLAMAQNFEDDRGVFSYFGPPSTETLSIADILQGPPITDPSNVDYTATTYALQTRCEPAPIQCVNETFPSTSSSGCHDPKCGSPFRYRGDPKNMTRIAYYTNSSMMTESGTASISNPFYFAYAGVFDRNYRVAFSQWNDPNIKIDAKGRLFYILYCKTTSYDVAYDSVDRTITRFRVSESNDTVANFFQAPMAMTDMATARITVAAEDATMLSTSSSEAAHRFAASINTITLAMGAQIVERRPAIQAQRRTTRLLAQMRKIPVLAFIAASGLLVVVALCLAAYATIVSLSDADVHDLRNRVSIPGLAAHDFERCTAAELYAAQVRALFGEFGPGRPERVVVAPSGHGGLPFCLLNGGRVAGRRRSCMTAEEL